MAGEAWKGSLEGPTSLYTLFRWRPFHFRYHMHSTMPWEDMSHFFHHHFSLSFSSGKWGYIWHTLSYTPCGYHMHTTWVSHAYRMLTWASRCLILLIVILPLSSSAGNINLFGSPSDVPDVGVTCAHTTSVSHARQMGITCTPHGYHMQTECLPEVADVSSSSSSFLPLSSSAGNISLFGSPSAERSISSKGGGGVRSSCCKVSNVAVKTLWSECCVQYNKNSYIWNEKYTNNHVGSVPNSWRTVVCQK